MERKTIMNDLASRKRQKFFYVILSFGIPFAGLLAVILALHITPFGKHSFALSDGMIYVYGLPGHGRFLKALVQGRANLLYSLGGLGQNAWCGLSWGAFYPSRLLALFATMETSPDWFTWIVVTNCSLCGLTMYLMLAYLRGHKLSNLIFSTSYALMGFNVTNSCQVFFVIGPMFLPLVILGLTKLLRGKSPFVYIFSLGTSILFSYYFGFHLCVASALYFAAYLYVEGNTLAGKRMKLFGTWAVSSLLSGLLPAFFWLPALKALSGGGRLNQTQKLGLDYLLGENLPFIKIFTKLFSGANSGDEMMVGAPSIFCGILVVALVILFFMNKSVPAKRKKAAAIIAVFYLLTFFLTVLMLAMQGGTHANGFFFRYAYVFSFVLIFIAADEFEYLDEITLADTKRAGVIMVVSAVLIFSADYKYVSGGMVVVDFVLLFVMWLGFWLYKTKPEAAPKQTLALLLVLLVSVNMYGNFVVSIEKVQKEDGWELNLDKYGVNVFKYGALIDAIRTVDTSFYRMEKDEPDLGSASVDAGLYGYYGVSASGPSVRAFINQQSCKIGLNWNDMRHWYSAGIPAATDALLGLKYIVSGRDLTMEKGYEQICSLMDQSVYGDPNALQLSILGNAELSGLTLGDNIFENLNCIWKSMTGGSEDIFIEQEDVTYSLHNNTTDESITSKELKDFYAMLEAGEETDYHDNAYIEYTFEATRDGSVYVFDTSIPSSINGLHSPAIRYVGNYEKGDTVRGNFEIDGYGTSNVLRGYCINQVFAYADDDVLQRYAKQLNERDITFDRDKDSHLFGTFTAEPGQRILFTLPWDEGWTCYIDGRKVPIDKTWDLFMSIEAPEGRHTYEMKFFPAWMDYGLIISGAAFVGLVVFMVIWRKKSRAIPVEKTGDSLNESPA